MTDRTYSSRVQQALDALPAAALAVALEQLQFTDDHDEQLGVVAESWIQVRLGQSTDTAANTVGRRRRAERRTGSMIDMLDGSWDNIEPVWLGSSVGDDPAASLEAWQVIEQRRAISRAHGVPAVAAATHNGEACDTTDLVSGWLHRCVRSVQATMRRICGAELAGQGVLPGVPPAREVYSARALDVPAPIQQPTAGSVTGTMAGWIQRCKRAVQTTMRRICRIEHAGQMVLPCVPPAAEVHLQSVQGGAA